MKRCHGLLLLFFLALTREYTRTSESRCLPLAFLLDMARKRTNERKERRRRRRRKTKCETPLFDAGESKRGALSVFTTFLVKEKRRANKKLSLFFRFFEPCFPLRTLLEGQELSETMKTR